MRSSNVHDTFIGMDLSLYALPMIAVYEHPLDFPEHYVARLFDINKSTPHCIVKDTLEEIRAAIPEHFHRLERAQQDEPQIVEVWL